MKIKVIIKRPGRKPYSTYIENSQENLQRTVGAPIKAELLSLDMAVIHAERRKGIAPDGRVWDLEHNCRLCGAEFYGEIVICGIRGNVLTDLPINWQEAKQIFAKLWDDEKRGS